MSRRKGRYERRQQKRCEKLIQNNDAVGGLDKVYTFHSMYAAGKQCCNGVRWKQSTQNFERHLFSTTARNIKKVRSHSWKSAKYTHFTLRERGKERPIDAPRIQDRQIHKVFTQKVLLPLYAPSMIYNNGASLPNKGFEFSKRELKKDLIRHFKRYGRAGYVILIDFTKFFPSVSHDKIKQRHKRLILNDDLRKIADDIVDTMQGGIGLPLGVEPSQAEMIAFPSALDNFIKCQLSVKGAGHYMDDYYILVPPDKDPEKILRIATARAGRLKLSVSLSKTKITPLSKPFKYCKATYTLTETGKVIINGNRASVKRARRKIRAFKSKIENKEMTYEDLWTSVNGMLAYFGKYNNHARVLSLRRYFYSTFGFSSENIINFRIRESGIMTKYIVYRRFKGKCLAGMVNLPRGTECEEIGGAIIHNGKVLVANRSESAYQYFARNDDGNGLERGKLIQSILKTLSDNHKAWQAIWQDTSLLKFKRPEHEDYWLWNYDFYNAEIKDLKYILRVVKGT